MSEGYFRFLCPRCGEMRATVNPRNNLAHCFCCQKNLNNIDLLITLDYDFRLGRRPPRTLAQRAPGPASQTENLKTTTPPPQLPPPPDQSTTLDRFPTLRDRSAQPQTPSRSSSPEFSTIRQTAFQHPKNLTPSIWQQMRSEFGPGQLNPVQKIAVRRNTLMSSLHWQ